MDKEMILVHGKEFPIRTIEVNPTDRAFEGLTEVSVADYELWAEIEDEVENEVREMEAIDETIFYYCDSGFIASDPTDEEIVEYLKENIS